MNLSMIALCVAATALIALCSSAATGLAILPMRRTIDAITPAAQARVVLLLALLPAITTAAVMLAALAPTLGWIADHCLPAGHSHGHPHICEHHVAALPALPLLAIAGVFAARVALSVLAIIRTLLVSASACRGLERSSSGHGQGHGQGHVGTSCEDARMRVLPLQAPRAFVLGVLRPTLYVTRGLLSAAHRDHLAAVLAHERAHVRRADPLRMLVANVALALHLPGLAGALRRRLLLAQELAADAEAADAIGSRARVAQALVDLARAQHALPQSALAFGACDVETRVRQLLDERPRRDAPSRVALLLGVGCALLVLAAQAEAVHHGVERLLGVIGG